MIARVAGDESIVIRLRAELSIYRFRVFELPASAQRSTILSELANEREAQAALRAKPEAMAVELWVRTGGSGAVTSQELVTAGPSRDPQVLATRVTEAMRARGLTLPPLTAAGPKPADVADAADGGKRAAPPSAPDADTSAPEPADAEPADAEPAEPKPPPVAAVPVTPPAKPNQVEPERPSAEPPRPKAPVRAPEAVEAAASSEPKPPRQAENTIEADAEPEPKPEPEAQDAADQAGGLTVRDALLYAEVGPTGVWSPGANRVGLALDALISFRFRPYPTSSISLVGLIPLLSTDVTTGDGAAVQVQTYGIGGFGDLNWPLGQLELSAGLGGLALLSSVMVFSSPGAPVYRPVPTQRLAALLGRIGASLALTRDLRLSGSIMAGLTVRELQLARPKTDAADAVADADSTLLATWGRPLFFGTLSLELALPWDR